MAFPRSYPAFDDSDTDGDDGFVAAPLRQPSTFTGSLPPAVLRQLSGFGLDDPSSLLSQFGGASASAPRSQRRGTRRLGANEIAPSDAYLQGVSVPSQEQPSDHPLLPLDHVILSIEGVLGCSLPHHLSGGHSDFLSRTYLTTLMDYLLHPNNRWSVAFWTGSMSRKQGLKALRQLKLPTGSPEKDERDGVVGLWSKEDLRQGTDDSGAQIGVKDLEIIWKELEEEEGIRWTLEDTVVITDYPGFMAAQPNNFIMAPSFHYKTTVNFTDDQFLLMMIAVLEDLTTESNFAAHIKELGWDDEDYWMSPSPKQASKRDFVVHNAVRVAAKMKIPIIATGGN
ncbi:hypothetical protein T439DRAFT_336696 [Meredithblackwellia eburnea MCA 4105]